MTDPKQFYAPVLGLTPGHRQEALVLASWDAPWVMTIMTLAVAYQAILCFLYTFGIPTSAALVGLSEALIMLACLPILARRFLPGLIVIALLAGAWFCLATLLTGHINVKAVRDLAIPLCFFWLGCNLGRPDLAERALLAIVALIMALGFFELLQPNIFTNYFNIFGYYVSTGSLQPITEYVRESRLQLNGLRPEGIGRTLLPGLLGPHRVSSVFLEPVSLGNFATLLAAWGLSRDWVDWRRGGLFLGSAIVLMVLSDSRFALMLVPLMIAMRLVLRGGALNLAILAPFMAVGLLVFVGLQVTDMGGDNLMGRLAISGWALLEFDVPMLLGLGSQPHFGDMGYAYLISRFGLPLCLLLWFSFWLLPLPDERGQRFRAFVSIYIALILAVSGTSLFAFKSAALLWFLVGCLLRSAATLTDKPKLQAAVNQSWQAGNLAGSKPYVH